MPSGQKKKTKKKLKIRNKIVAKSIKTLKTVHIKKKLGKKKKKMPMILILTSLTV